ncbi:MAG: hypothetical protein RI935_245 [Candidatus Parcubacteria bacterium]|jgi:uncharacterized cofD-like protein
MKKIVTVGGGTGSFTVLSGIKNIPHISITALVSMADDGGSTGVLRDELGVLPPGDVRQCLVALSEHSDIVRKLMSYRFHEGSLSGHSFGNIFLAALEKVSGDFVHGIQVASEILKVKGSVAPVTSNKADLIILLKNNRLLIGEDELNHSNIQEVGIEKMFYKQEVVLNDHARKAILEADYIILGPGNYYCSLVPCLIVEGMKEVLHETSAKIIFPANLTNKHGHTMGWKITDYVKDIESYIGKEVDCVLINNESPTQEQIDAYKIEEGDGVMVLDDYDKDNAVRQPLLSHTVIQKIEGDAIHSVRSFIRHDSHKLKESIDTIIFSS